MKFEKDANILNIVQEDILEALKREKGKSLLSSVKPEIYVSHSILSKAIDQLKNNSLVKVEDNLIFLTKRGSKKAKKIVEKHQVIENYFKQKQNSKKAFKAASILEHYVSQEVIENIKEMSTFEKQGIFLNKFNKRKGIIVDIIAQNSLFERIVSMGICPGEKIEIMNQRPNVIIVKIENKKFAIDNEIGKKIKVLKL